MYKSYNVEPLPIISNENITYTNLLPITIAIMQNEKSLRFDFSKVFPNKH